MATNSETQRRRDFEVGQLIGQMVEISEIVKLRLVVGFLGERENAAWWPSMWLTSNASAFLTPVYGNRLSPARYHGVVEAARRVHDERIGIGQAFHLFRLPEGLERRLHEAVVAERACNSLADIAATDSAQNALSAFSQETQKTNPGPVRIGSPHDLRGRKWIPALAAQYRAAFASSIQTFPYFAERQ